VCKEIIRIFEALPHYVMYLHLCKTGTFVTHLIVGYNSISSIVVCIFFIKSEHNNVCDWSCTKCVGILSQCVVCNTGTYLRSLQRFCIFLVSNCSRIFKVWPSDFAGNVN
jgi:hypothetical protein